MQDYYNDMTRPNIKAMIGELFRGSRTREELLEVCHDRSTAEDDLRRLECRDLLLFEGGMFRPTAFVANAQRIYSTSEDDTDVAEAFEAYSTWNSFRDDCFRPWFSPDSVMVMAMLSDTPYYHADLDEMGVFFDENGREFIGIPDSMVASGIVSVDDDGVELTERGREVAEMVRCILAMLRDDRASVTPSSSAVLARPRYGRGKFPLID